MIDKNLCMSLFLGFRFVRDKNLNFFDGLSHHIFSPFPSTKIDHVSTTADIDRIIREKINEFYEPNKTAILLSGGMDSAILASYLPKGTTAYTFQCIAPGAINETEQAKKYTDILGLNHEIIEIKWEDFEILTPVLLRHNQVPFHSIEVQLLKASLYAQSKGIDRIIYGDAADYVFGGMDQIISKDWTYDEFYEKYTFLPPEKVLKNYVDIHFVYDKFKLENNKIDFLSFLHDMMDIESYTTYEEAFDTAGIKYLDPYLSMKMVEPWDLERIRRGESKYMIRELFTERYPNLRIPEKIPMPRAMNQWLKYYEPKRPEFVENCIKDLTGDQKWLCWCLERFLNMYDKEKYNV